MKSSLTFILNMKMNLSRRKALGACMVAISLLISLSTFHITNVTNRAQTTKLFKQAASKKKGIALNYNEIQVKVVSKHGNNKGDLPISTYTKGLPRELLIVLQHMYQEVIIWDEIQTESIELSNFASFRCPGGHYRLQNSSKCEELVTCDTMGQRITNYEHIGITVNKKIYSAKLDNLTTVVAKVSDPDNAPGYKYVKRVKLGIKNVLLLQPSPFVTQVVGSCVRENGLSVLFTEGYFKYGSLRFLAQNKKDQFFKLSIRTRFRMATQILASLDYLHNYGPLPRVYCDFHSAYQSLGQFLLTDVGQIVLNDMDEVPTVDLPNEIFAYCRPPKELTDDVKKFLAPEESFTIEELDSGNHSKPLTEKSNVWKIPDISKILLIPPAAVRLPFPEEEKVMIKLEKIHTKCKEMNFQNRPNIKEVLIKYLEIFRTMYPI